DQEPRNNFFTRALTWNEGGILNGARHVAIAGTRFFVSADAGVVELDMNDPLHPRVIAVIPIPNARASMVQFRYLFVVGGNGSDGVNGLKVIQLMSPESQPNFYGFSPDPRPQLIAWSPTRSPALSLSRGLERDRGVDETGHQIAVFGRIGSRPFTEEEMKKFY